MKNLWPVLLAFAALGAAAEGVKLSERELSARYHYDLGPTSIDVSTYSKRQQKNYATFVRVCAQCHTLARAINAPIMSERGWKYYVFKMRLGSAVSSADISREEAQAVVDFLTYDAKKRKYGDSRFEEADRRRRVRYNEIFSEKMRRLQENARHIRY